MPNNAVPTHESDPAPTILYRASSPSPAIQHDESPRLLADTVRGYGLIPLPQDMCLDGQSIGPISRVQIDTTQVDEATAASFTRALTLWGWCSDATDSACAGQENTRRKAYQQDAEGTHHKDQSRDGQPDGDTPELLIRLVTHHAEHPQGYTLTTRSSGSTPTLTISAPTPQGHFYAGLTTGCLVARNELTSHTTINDRPRFEHRGMMIDVARSYQELSVLRDIVDAAALLKMNALHLHLVDDQGWRLEITNEGRRDDDPLDYTQLHLRSGATAVNAGTNPGIDIGWEQPDTTEHFTEAPTPEPTASTDAPTGFDPIPEGRAGWYSQQDMRELVAYAAQRHVTIIPELEFPGHNHSVLHALPELATDGAWVQANSGQVNPWTRWQVGYSYLDFTNPATWTLAEHLMRQVGNVFGWEHLHLGGDECFNLILTVGEERYDAIVSRIVELAQDLGFAHITLWQEGVRAFPQISLETALQDTDSQGSSGDDNTGLGSAGQGSGHQGDAGQGGDGHDGTAQCSGTSAQGHTRPNWVQIWNYSQHDLTHELLAKAATSNARIINSDARRAYLDQKIHLDDPRGLTWAAPHGVTTADAYQWDPTHDMPESAIPHVAGIEACLWSETVRTHHDVHYLTLPRLAAISEIAWTDQHHRDWDNIKQRLSPPSQPTPAATSGHATIPTNGHATTPTDGHTNATPR